jgi:uncharacterized protein (DUF2141 family)
MTLHNPNRFGRAILPLLTAVVVLHDENLNHKLDRNLVGIPKEGFDLSNNPKGMLSAPGFDTATFDVMCPATDVRIHLIYK